MKSVDVTNDGLALGVLVLAFACLFIGAIVSNRGGSETVVVSMISLANAAIGGVLGYIRGSKSSNGGDVNNE